MILWTIQPKKVLDLIQREGVYHCDEDKAGINDFSPEQYEWLASQMRKRLGPPPEGVNYPVWAYQRWRSERVKPDIRSLRWYWGHRGEKLCRLEIDIPDSQVLLSDFDAWGVMLNFGLLSDTEDEDNELYKLYDALPPDAQKAMRCENWERVFDITPLDNDWVNRGEIVQATFWELRKENIRKITIFTSQSKYQ